MDNRKRRERLFLLSLQLPSPAMSEHLALRSSVGSRSSAIPSHQHHHLLPNPDPLASVWIRRLHLTPNPDPLASVWIRRLHLMPNPPPPPPPRPPPLPLRAPPPPSPQQDAVSTDESRTPPPPPIPHSPGFGPFHWSMRPLRGAPVCPLDATAVSGSAGGGVQPMLSPFFRLPSPPSVTPVMDIRDTAPVSPLIRLGSSSGRSTGTSTRMAGGGDHNVPWFAARAAGDAYPSHALDMVPIRTLNDVYDRQHGVKPQYFARHDPSSSSQHDEPFSYWNMGRFRRDTTTSSISPIGVDVVPGNFGNKRNANSTSLLPLKFRKISGAI